MIKTKKTKEILKEWRSFNQQNMISENQSLSQSQRKKIEPSGAAKKLKSKLEDVFGKGRFFCYDVFDKHSEDEMINPEYGYQHEIEALTNIIKTAPWLSDFPKNVDVADIVMGTDENYDITLDVGLKDSGEFDLDWSSAGPSPYCYGKIDVDGDMYQVIYTKERSPTYYF